MDKAEFSIWHNRISKTVQKENQVIQGMKDFYADVKGLYQRVEGDSQASTLQVVDQINEYGQRNRYTKELSQKAAKHILEVYNKCVEIRRTIVKNLRTIDDEDDRKEKLVKEDEDYQDMLHENLINYLYELLTFTDIKIDFVRFDYDYQADQDFHKVLTTIMLYIFGLVVLSVTIISQTMAFNRIITAVFLMSVFATATLPIAPYKPMVKLRLAQGGLIVSIITTILIFLNLFI